MQIPRLTVKLPNFEVPGTGNPGLDPGQMNTASGIST